jgi:hypothetical protein
MASDPAPLLGRASAPPRAHDFGHCLPTREGSDATMCPVAPDPASLLMRAPALPRAPWLWTMPPCSGGLRRGHVPRGSGPCIPAREGSGAATFTAAPDPASLFRRVSGPRRAPRLWTLTPFSEGLRRCHMSHDSQLATSLRNKERSSCPRYATRLTCFQGTLTRYRGTCKTCGQAASS